ncbi:unannotated protein [freshwater metagenome]|uniref:receptor protein-tyrosine kinase n=1 Tax=freshwater metagenome TaxID=449393 RepID=A0A6J6J2E6_9ZZZZ
MHRKVTPIWPKLAAIFIALIISMFFLQKALATTTDPEPVCVANRCTVTFEMLGEPQVWIPPTGARNLRFEIFGGQGGQGTRTLGLGGFGGRVAGEFLELPASLTVVVGDSGARGSGAEGGFNGGGAAGAGQGDEGSGGGATDLRTSSSLEDRIAVAGGGGGAGARNWDGAGLGGSGGTLIGGPGGWGQAGPGTGGGQFSGGFGGVSVGGPKGSPGDFGLGGRGASSRFAGGGGGGGGYYGGGGGGSDVDSGGLNGGGGGGGSSYANSSLFKNLEHTAGVHSDAGLAILTYDLVEVQPPKSADTTSDATKDSPPDLSSDSSTDAPPEVSTDLNSDQHAAPSSEPSPSPTPELSPATRPEVAAERTPEPVTTSGSEPLALLEPEVLEPETFSVEESPPAVWLPVLPPVANVPAGFERKPQSLPEPSSHTELKVESIEAPTTEPARMPPPEPSIDFVPWMNALSGLSLLIGLIQAVRRLKQNRRASARRFVRIS